MTTAVSPVLDRLRHTKVRPTEVVRAAYGWSSWSPRRRRPGASSGCSATGPSGGSPAAGCPSAHPGGADHAGRQPARTAGRRRGGCAARRDHGRLGGRRPPPGSAGLGRGADRDPVRGGRAGAVAASARSRPWVGVRPPGRRARPLEDTGRADGRLGGRGLPEAGRARAPEPERERRCGAALRRAPSPRWPGGAGARRPATSSGSCSRSWRAGGCPPSRHPGSGPWPPTRRWAASTSSARRRSATPGCRCRTLKAAAEGVAAGPGRAGPEPPGRPNEPGTPQRSVDSG